MSIEPGVELPESSRRGVLKVTVRLAIGAVVVAVLIVRTPSRGAVADALRNAQLGWVLLGGAVLVGGLVVSSFRWKAYLDALELRLPAPTVMRLYFVGTFFNAFLPSGIGGDAYKAVRIGRPRGTYTNAFASVFLDRFAGFVGLASIGLVGAIVELAQGSRGRAPAVAALAASGMLAGAGILLLGGERLLGRGRLIKSEGISGKVRGAVRAIHEAARHPEAAARGYVLGVAFQGLVLACHVLVARALGLGGISVAAMTGVVVIASLAALIPLSPGGLGFREAGYVWALGTFGVGHDRALAFALLILAIVLATSAMGAVVYIARGGDVAPADIEPSE